MIPRRFETLTAAGIGRWWGPRTLAAPRVTLLEIDCRAWAPEFLRLQALLSSPEREQVCRMTHPERRRRKALVRGILRLALGACLGMAPKQVPLTRDALGRPALASPADELGWAFSCASCLGFGVIAIGDGGRVGVDVEAVDPQRFPEDLAESMLHADEATLFAAVQPAARTRWLAEAWVRKESVLKATGLGLEVDPCGRVPIRGVSPQPGES